jgi:hypothetical protein
MEMDEEEERHKKKVRQNEWEDEEGEFLMESFQMKID